MFWWCSMLTNLVGDMFGGGKFPGDYKCYAGAQYLKDAIFQNGI
jgi:hypothetical protein